LRQDVLDGVKLRWGELRAIEKVWDEYAGELADEDLIHPDCRALMADLKSRLRTLADRYSTGRRRRLPEPSAQGLGMFRELVSWGLDYLGMTQD
jgi:hypothetical protein